MSSLEAYVQHDLQKLKKRLVSLGVPDVTLYDYESYLRSTLWRKIKEWVHARDNNSCLVCRDRKLVPVQEFDVHHRSYDLATMEGRNDQELVTLCRRCHNKIEYYSNGLRRFSIDEKEVEYQRLRALHEEIVANGLPVRLLSSRSRGCDSHLLTYSGPIGYLEFYKLDNLMHSFVVQLYVSHKEELRLPRRYSLRTFREPSGGVLIHAITGRRMLQVTCSENSATIRSMRACVIPVASSLLKTIEDDGHWRLDVDA